MLEKMTTGEKVDLLMLSIVVSILIASFFIAPIAFLLVGRFISASDWPVYIVLFLGEANTLAFIYIYLYLPLKRISGRKTMPYHNAQVDKELAEWFEKKRQEKKRMKKGGG
jgi:hypothetical protein